MTEGDAPRKTMQKWLTSLQMPAISLKLIIYLFFTKGITEMIKVSTLLSTVIFSGIGLTFHKMRKD